MTDSSIIQSGSNISNVEVNVSTAGDDLEKMKKFVDLLKTEYPQYNLTFEQKSEMEADIKSMESQLTSPKPKIDIAKQNRTQCLGGRQTTCFRGNKGMRQIAIYLMRSKIR